MIKKQGIRCLLAGLVATGVIASSISVFAGSTQKQLSVTYNGIKVNLNGQQLSLRDSNGKSVESFNYNGTVYAPLRGISQALGMEVAYDSTSKTVTLTGTVSSSTQQAATSGNTSTGTPPAKPGSTTSSAVGMGTPPDGTPPAKPGSTTSSAVGMGTPPDGTPPAKPESTTQSTIDNLKTDNTSTGNTSVKAENKKIIASEDSIKVILNGTEISLKDANGKTILPINFNGTIYLPVRAISQALGLTVAYDTASSTVKLTYGNASGTAPNTQTDGTGSNTSTASTTGTAGTAVYSQTGNTVTKAEQAITATKVNESAVMVADSGTLSISGSTITKASGDTTSEEDSNFYGLNAAVLAKSGSTVNISNTSIGTTSDGSNAIFATGDGSTVNVSNVSINTTENSSRGLDATYNGTINATNVYITTAGDHCGAIATDRGEGTITVTGGTMNTSGEGSPGIYSTGNITVTDATLKATGSEAAAIEGKNSITLTDTTLSGAVKWGVMIYQSFSEDAGVGTGTFTMTRGSLTAEVGPLFYSTNTNAVINLTDVELSAASGILLTAGANQWGTTGANGANVTLTGDTQILSGNITCDSISTIAVVLKNNSTLTSTINADNKAKAMTLSLDSNSTWVVTGTSYLTSLTDANTVLSNIDDNGNTIYYDASNSANSWLAGLTYSLQDGGRLTPVPSSVN